MMTFREFLKESYKTKSIGLITREGDDFHSEDPRKEHHDIARDIGYKHTKHAIDKGAVRYWHGDAMSGYHLKNDKQSISNAVRHIKYNVNPASSVMVDTEHKKGLVSHHFSSPIQAIHHLNSLKEETSLVEGHFYKDFGFYHHETKEILHPNENESSDESHNKLAIRHGYLSTDHAIHKGAIRFYHTHANYSSKGPEVGLEFKTTRENVATATKHLKHMVSPDHTVQLDTHDPEKGTYNSHVFNSPRAAIKHLNTYSKKQK
jgi:hypothetical protein